MDKLTYVYSLIGSELILKKYGLSVDKIASNDIGVSKKSLFKDIKKGLKHLIQIGFMDRNEFKDTLHLIKINIKNSDSFMDAVKPFLYAVIKIEKGGISSD